MRLLLVFSLLLNGALGLYFMFRPHLRPTTGQAEPSIRSTASASPAAEQRETNTAQATSTTAPAGAFSWQGVESADYHQYIANLRAIGCPEPVIHDLIATDMQKVFARRAKAIRGELTAHQYWQKYNYQRPTLQQVDQLMALQKEHGELFQSVLGTKLSSQSIIDAVYLQTDRRIAELGWLPEDKRAAARRAFEVGNLREMEISSEDEDRDFRARERKFLEARVALLKDVLSPAELKEYRLRSSTVAASLVQETKYLELSYEDFLKVLKITDELGDQKGRPYGRTDERMQAVRAVLGEARAEEFERKTDFNYDGARMATERLNLPEDTSDRVWQIKRDAIAAARQVQVDDSLSNAEKEQRYQAMRVATRATLMQLLGQEGFEMTQRRNRDWLDMLGILKQ